VHPRRRNGTVARLPTTRRDTFIHGAALALACLVAYEVVVEVLSRIHSISHEDDVLGGMWAVVSAIFVYRDTNDQSRNAATSRAVATFASFVICFVYLLFFGFSPVGMAILIGAGVILVTLAGRPQDGMTVAISTAVILVIAGLAPENQVWQEPLLRLLDTLAGIVIGVAVGTLVARLTARTA
jgi:uncharacterized membrane protein YccC